MQTCNRLGELPVHACWRVLQITQALATVICLMIVMQIYNRHDVAECGPWGLGVKESTRLQYALILPEYVLKATCKHKLQLLWFSTDQKRTCLHHGQGYITRLFTGASRRFVGPFR